MRALIAHCGVLSLLALVCYATTIVDAAPLQVGESFGFPSSSTTSKDSSNMKRKWNGKDFTVDIKLEIADLGGGAYDMENIMMIEAGTPPQTIPVIFDTGSYWPVLWNASCTDVGCGTQAKYNSAKSTTAKVSNHVSLNYYGAGKVTGLYTQDDITMTSGGNRFFTMYKNFSLIQHAHWSSPINQYNFDGFFGMGPPISQAVTEGPTSTTVHMMEQGLNQFAVWLPRGAPFLNGQVQFGGYNKLTDQQVTTWAPVLPSEAAAWTIALDDVKVNGQSTKACNKYKGQCVVTLDTGAGEIDMAGFGLPYTPESFNCSEMSRMANVTWVIEGANFTLEPVDYVLQVGNGMCYSSIFIGLETESMNNKDKKKGTVVNHHKMKMQRKYGDRALPHYPTLEQQPEAANYVGVQLQTRFLTVFDIKENKIGFLQHD